MMITVEKFLQIMEGIKGVHKEPLYIRGVVLNGIDKGLEILNDESDTVATIGQDTVTIYHEPKNMDVEKE